MYRLLLLIVLTISLISCKQNKTTIQPQKKDIVQVVYASGKIYPVNVYNVYSKLPGYISKLYVKIGDTVKAGQPLLIIRSEISEKNLEIARNHLKLATDNISENSNILKSLKNDIQAAYSRYKLDSVNFERYNNLLKNNATSLQQFDAIKTQFESSKQNYFKLLNNYEQTKTQLKIEYENAKLQYDAQLSNLNEYTIYSAINGKVYDVLPKEGELINTTTLLMVIGNQNQFEVELNVDETDINLIQQGQTVYFETDVYKNKIFNGHIQQIYQRINPVNKTCRVIASINADNMIFYSGMSVEANILVNQKQQALVIPKNYLYNDSMVVTSSGDTLKVQKGIEDLEYVEILNGIDEKTELIEP
ncbi:MAG: hypothetical protein KatS3mg027_0468 [Bacteroidia bacterium]|nr:MAG: hypothetical protein KatS3mg027_0468 [Bacteroidia bacterium]